MKKAYLVREKDEFCADIVFAETRQEARKLAYGVGACEDVAFIDIEVCRMPQLDKYYQEGKNRMDWENADDRLILVKECGFYCEYIELDECTKCSAKDYCESYKDLIGVYGENNE